MGAVNCEEMAAPACEWQTIVGFGSLLSKRSALTTTPSLRNYQYVKVNNFQRIFRHPAAVFFERGEFPGIAKPETKEISSLSTLPSQGHSFVACAYQIPKDEWEPLREREEEFSFVNAEFTQLEEGAPEFEGGNVGFMCTASTDEALQNTSLWPRYQKYLECYGETKVWSWSEESGILPCPVYTRHCVLAARNAPDYVTDSFLDDTFLADKTTPLRAYLEATPELMDTEPPAEFRERYSG